jgi:di/tricarboxylate transporter
MMTWEAVLTLAVLAAVLYALARNAGAPDLIFLSGAVVLTTLSLVSRRFPSPRETAAMFGNEALLTVGALYVVAAGLTETGALSLIAERLLGRPKSAPSAQLRMMFPVTAISGFLNNTPVVAMFLPAISDWCKRNRMPASKLFMPLSYAAILGGLCTLIGTSTNLVVRGLMEETAKTDPSIGRLGMWTITPVGLPIALISIAAIVILSRRLLPDRAPQRLELSDPREYTIEMNVRPDSAIDGMTIEEAGLRNLAGAYLIEIQRGEATIVAVGPQERLRGGDRLIFVGVVESVLDLQKVRGLVPAADQVFKLTDPRHERCLVEAVVSASFPLLGKNIREGRFRTRYDAAVIAVQRGGKRIASKIGDIVLEAGDVLLLETHPRFLEQHRNDRGFLLVSAVADSTPKRHERAGIALTVLAGLVIAMSFEGVTGLSVFNIALIGALVMIATRCCSLEQARRSIDWTTLIAIGGSFVIGKAMETSGAATVIADGIMSVFRFPGAGAWGVLAGVYVLTLVFTEFVTNNAAAALSFPVAYAASQSLDVSFLPFAVAITIAASAAFALPTGYATHLMVHAAGGYRLSDWLKMGIPLDVLVMLCSLALIPLLFPF